MSIRVTALCLLVAGLSVYAWKDWFKSLCGLILLMVVIKHPDMPKTLFGIQGLSPWNVLLAVILLAWVVSRRRERLVWDMPRPLAVLLLMYLGVILVGALRAILDRSYIEDYPLVNLISDELINTIKWVVPGVLLYDGCRTRHRMTMALACVLTLYTLISVQLVRNMPLAAATSGGTEIQYLRMRVCSRVSSSADDTSAMLAGASWGMLAVLPLVRKKKWWLMVLAAAGLVAFGQALTGGRAGYAAWGATGLLLCLLKWRKHLLLAPLIVLLVPIIVPGAVDRMFTGFGQTDVTGQAAIDMYSVTSNRWLIWPEVIQKISRAPLVGYGRLAMKRTGLMEYIGSQYGDSQFPHPHNMYLETLLDNGIIGSLPIFLFWGTVVALSARLFRTGNRLYAAVGGLALSLMLAQFLAGMGAQHFYPLESTVGMWAAMFLMLRVAVEEKAARQTAVNAQDSWTDLAFFPQVPLGPVYTDGVRSR